MHDRISNYNTKILKTNAWLHGVGTQYDVDSNTYSGSYLSFLIDLYRFLKPINNPCSKKQVLPLLSSMESSLWFALKALVTYEMLELNITLNIFLLDILDKVASMNTWEKACMAIFKNSGSPPRKNDSWIRIFMRRLFQKLHVENLFILVWLNVAYWRERSTNLMKRKI